ncbi:MAG: cytochrome c [Phycisphaerales bacterium]|nr:cytochrome c [Phycisphaerales bacterium]
MATSGAALGALVLTSGLAGCRGDTSNSPPHQFFPDMDDSPRFNPQSQTAFFENDRTMRQPVANTIPFSRWSGAPDAAPEPYAIERASFLKADDAVYRGVDGSGAWVTTIPVPVDVALLERGRERYTISCSVCHGGLGDGKGMVGDRWAYALPSFHDPKYKGEDPEKSADGYLFHVSRVGVIDTAGNQKMPGYAHALSEHDSWAVVAYIRALQKARGASLSEVPDAERTMLEGMRGASNQGSNGAEPGGEG